MKTDRKLHAVQQGESESNRARAKRLIDEHEKVRKLSKNDRRLVALAAECDPQLIRGKLPAPDMSSSEMHLHFTRRAVRVNWKLTWLQRLWRLLGR